MRYRSRTYIDAIQWTGKNKEEVELFIGHNGGVMGKYVDITTHNGLQVASIGDYIAKLVGDPNNVFPLSESNLEFLYKEEPDSSTQPVKLRYEVGDKVRVKNTDWYNNNKDENNEVKDIATGYFFIEEMSSLCGKTLTIKRVYSNHYDVVENDFLWVDGEFEDEGVR